MVLNKQTTQDNTRQQISAHTSARHSDIARGTDLLKQKREGKVK